MLYPGIKADLKSAVILKETKTVSTELDYSGHEVMRAVDHFWGESWPLGPVRSADIYTVTYDDASKPVKTLEETHSFDGHGALVESLYFDHKKPCTVRRNDYDSSACLACRTSTDLETGDSTTWTYSELGEGRRVIALATSNEKAGHHIGYIYSLNDTGRVLSCEIIMAASSSNERWECNSLQDNTEELRVITEAGGLLISWRHEYDAQGRLTRVEQLSSNGQVEEERRYVRNYDDHGNWIWERMTVIDMMLGPLFTKEVSERIQVLVYR